MSGTGGRSRAGSASGLRPATAFAVVALVLVAVSAKAAYLTFVVGGGQPEAVSESASPWPSFEIVDRTGRPLALSVECFDLTLSPQSMWRSHTPDYMAGRIAEVLGDVTPTALLERMLPEARGWCPRGHPLLQPAQPRLLRFGPELAQRVQAWIQRGALEKGQGQGPIDGLWVVPVDERSSGGESTGVGYWTLRWDPHELLSAATRRRHLAGGDDVSHRPEVWTRRLLRDLDALVLGSPEARALEASLASWSGGGGGAAGRRRARRDAIWAELIPSTFRVLRRRVDPVTAHTLSELLRAEAVSPWQMKLRVCLERRHPVRPDAARPVATRGAGDADPAPARRDDAFTVLGHWGVLGREDALRRARHERDRAPHLLDWSAAADPVGLRAWQLETEWRPWSGLELLCAEELGDSRWRSRLAQGARTYSRRLRHLSRDRRLRWTGHSVPNYFEAATDALDVPRFECTLDAELQERVHQELLDAMREYRAALAEAIVVEVESGDVLALDGVYAYDMQGFAPLRHEFTPGSVLKAVIMAIALDQGLVTPDESFETFAPQGIVVRDGSSARLIREAEGAPQESTLSAERGLARSVNAVLVQIGLRIPAPALRDKLVALGYGRTPGVGLGPEASGRVPPLDGNGSWSRAYTHASVSFGHEIAVTLWQHAAAMATIARGGLHRPLRLLRAVEQGEVCWELAPAPGTRVLSARACAQVREMMALAAREGTGRKVASPEHCPEFAYVGTKTGTTEKVHTEVSLHVEWPRQLELAASGQLWTRAEHRALIGARNNLGFHSATCYTSSMCALGDVEGSGRQILVVVVLDEPRATKKFGADVAGPSAVRILRQACGLQAVAGLEPPSDPVPGRAAFNPEELPWAAESR